MRCIRLAFLAILLWGLWMGEAAAALPADENYTPPRTFLAEQGVFVRSGKGEAPVLATLRPGERVSVSERVEGYYVVRLPDGREGMVWWTFLKPASGEAAHIEPAETAQPPASSKEKTTRRPVEATDSSTDASEEAVMAAEALAEALVMEAPANASTTPAKMEEEVSSLPETTLPMTATLEKYNVGWLLLPAANPETMYQIEDAPETFFAEAESLRGRTLQVNLSIIYTYKTQTKTIHVSKLHSFTPLQE